MKGMSNQRFDRLWRKAVVVEYAEIKKRTAELGSKVAELRRHIYRFACYVLAMEKYHHNDLVAMIESEGSTPTAWMDEHFELIEAMGDNRQRIFAALDAGVTEREYVEQGELVLARRRVNTAALPKPATDRVEIKPPEDPAERAEFFEDLAASYKSELQGLRKRHHKTEQDLALAVHKIEQLEAELKRIKRSLDRGLSLVEH